MPKKTSVKSTTYKFQESKNTACIVCDHVMNKKRPILFVSHESEDSSWQFLCGQSDHTDKNYRILSLEEVTNIDNSVNELWEMTEGFSAERKTIGDSWKTFETKSKNI